MKKLNNNGFTLVELLAVVVILAIIVGVTIPISNRVISNSKHKTLGVFVDTAEKFMADQWRINKTDPETTTDAFRTVISDYELDEWVTLDVSNDNHRTLIEEMGIPSKEVKTVNFMIDKDGISCVVITKIPNSSAIYNSLYWKPVAVGDDTELIPNVDNDRYYSNCCLYEDVQGLFTE